MITSLISGSRVSDSSSIEFLDVLLMADGDRIASSLYRKPCTGNTLLRADSNHLGLTIRSIPVGQFCRLKHLC